ncbi:DUF4276 family protein [Microbacterium ulmi]|uniref:DUF4276 family protein n=1 Tax=Microbacterium ulmi TaxID=179095 RepID=A0A7Y2LYB3_9MICO|nr:hypothetical protein [Microbacterium ulmi]NNH03066.1 DUF4276 family protein [Microbacterium ulmi]
MRKIAIITEGESEWGALPTLYQQLRDATGASFLHPILLKVQPDGPPAKIARECKTAFKLLAEKRVTLVVVVLDREERSEPAGELARQIEDAIRDACHFSFDLAVVMKDRAFENWVVADLDALRAQPSRFNVTAAVERAVSPDRADRIAALDQLKRALRGSNVTYDKRQDSKRTFEKADVLRIAANSRSFRHFLHTVGHPSYATQCQAMA